MRLPNLVVVAVAALLLPVNGAEPSGATTKASIESTQGGSIIISVPSGAGVSIRVAGGAVVPLVMESELNTLKQTLTFKLDASDKRHADADKRIAKLEALVAKMAAGSEKTATTVSTLEAGLEGAVEAVSAVEANWEGHNKCLAGFLAAGAVVEGDGCPRKAGSVGGTVCKEPAAGTGLVVSGHGNTPKAIRLFTCKAGYDMAPAADGSSGTAAVCQKDGSWSHSAPTCSATTTTTTATTVTTSTQKPSKVKCRVSADNALHYAWADGKQLLTQQIERSIWEVVFWDYAKVLAFKASDWECGCGCGGLIMHCTSDNTNSAWHNYVTNDKARTARGIASLNKDYDKLDYANNAWTTAKFADSDAFKNLWRVPIASGGRTFSTTVRGQGVCAQDEYYVKLQRGVFPTFDYQLNPGGVKKRVYWWLRFEP